MGDQSLPGRDRRMVTVLFADLVGSTGLGERLDPERFGSVTDRFFGLVAHAIERHGGHLEKYIGDAVMAVFGVPMLHEDDALRGVRAALEIQQAMESLNAELTRDGEAPLAVRVGVNTGEVIAERRPVPGGRLVAGDSVNLAARLEQAAQPGDILISHSTYQLVRGRAAVGKARTVPVRGRTATLKVYRLVGLTPEGGGGDAAVFINRDRELKRLETAYQASAAGQHHQLITVIGPAGVGKSRLVRELQKRVTPAAWCLHGKCLPYGERITYWPISEIVRTATGIQADDDWAVASEKMGRVLRDEPDAETIGIRVGQAMGLVREGASRHELFTGLRRFLESLTRQQPLVVIIDDIHLGEATLLDFIEHLRQSSHRGPLLVVCLARPELLRRRPAWGGEERNNTTLTLEPLDEADSLRLVDVLAGAPVPTEARLRIVRAADGIPLFLEEILAMLLEDGYLREDAERLGPQPTLPEVVLPTTIQQLLAARLGQLEGRERLVVERAAVIGPEFDSAALEGLVPDEVRRDLPADLTSLVDKDLLRLDPSAASAGQHFRFRHTLIRDAAYASIAKAERAELHEAFANRLEETAPNRRSDTDAIIGYHLEQAYRYRFELRERDPATQTIGRRAGQMLARAGYAARQRDDLTAAVSLLSRAASLLPADDPLTSSTIVALSTLLGDPLGPMPVGPGRQSPGMRSGIGGGPPPFSQGVG